MLRNTRWSSWKVAGVLMVGLSGCAPGVGTVTGQATYHDQPLPSGSVTFFGRNNIVVSAPIQSDGRYTAEKVPAGVAKVTVVTPPQVAKVPARRSVVPPVMDPAFPREMAPPVQSRSTVTIPRRYAEPEQSGLSLTVTRDHTQTFDIPLHD